MTKTQRPKDVATGLTVDALRQIKVRLPIRHLVRLHGLMVCRQQTLSSIVEQALGWYFDEHGLPKAVPSEFEFRHP